MEAGVGTLARLPEGSLDLVLLVTEPTLKSADVSRRAAGIIAERKIAEVVLVANRVRDRRDLELIRSAIPHARFHVFPEDDAVTAAERDGVAVLDLEPGSPAVAASQRLASLAFGQHGAG